ncbi:unnamed protein product [Closterium sp. Yama58-4]|nr:unnamed protein product [Closterium sp. Yama58-4]
MESPKSSAALNIKCYSGQADNASSGISPSSRGSVTGTGSGGRTGSAAYNGSAASNPAGNASGDGLEGLNEEQRAAVVASPHGCVRVVAGPGSGKTRVLTHRVVNLIKNLGVHPRKILCITFTNRAANELVTRLQVLLSPEAAAAVHVGTFHGIAARILRHKMLPSLRNRRCYRDYTIYDEDDSLRVIKEIDKQEKERLAKISQYQPGKSNSAGGAAGGANPDGLYEAMSHLSLQSGDALSAAQTAVAEVLGDRGGGGAGGDGVDGDKEGNRLKNIRDAVLRYKEGGMKEDMRGRVGERRRGRFEAEESVWESGIIPRYSKLYEVRWGMAVAAPRLLSFQAPQKEESVWGSGIIPRYPKLYECIYSWRGAEYHYLQRILDEDFDDVTTLQLRSNYRSSQSILQAANQVIQGGPRDRRVGGGTLELKPTKPPGHPVFFSFFPSCASEAATIAEEIESLVNPTELSPWRGQAGARGGAGGWGRGGAGAGGRGWAGGGARRGEMGRARAGEGGGARGGEESGGYAWRDFCVLYRTHAQAVQLQQGLADLAIPCIVVGGSTLFQRKVGCCCFLLCPVLPRYWRPRQVSQTTLQQGLTSLAIPCIVVGGSTLFQRKVGNGWGFESSQNTLRTR